MLKGLSATSSSSASSDHINTELEPSDYLPEGPCYDSAAIAQQESNHEGFPASLLESPEVELTHLFRAKLAQATSNHLRQFNAGDELLNCYIPLRGCFPSQQGQNFDDVSVPIRQWLMDTQGQGNQSTVVVTGVSGSGKTLFGQHLIMSLWNSDLVNSVIPLWIPLLSIENPTYNLVRKHLELLRDRSCFGNDIILTETDIQHILKRPFILFLDGYDELNTSVNLYLSNEFDKNPNIQVIFSCRTEIMHGHLHHFGAAIPSFQVREYRLLNYQHDETRSQVIDYIQRVIAQQQVSIYPTSSSSSSSSSPSQTDENMWGIETYIQHINLLPELNELITNPFILYMVVCSLPRIVEKYQAQEALHKRLEFTRHEIYETFMTAWFDRRANKLLRSGQEWVCETINQLRREQPDLLLSQLFSHYTQGLALAMFRRHINEIDLPPSAQSSTVGLASSSTQPTSSRPWQTKWLDNLDATDYETRRLRLLRENCPLIPLGNHRYIFMHKSILEFFAAKHLFDGALIHAWIRAGRNLNVSGLLDEPETVKFMVDRVQQDKAFELALWQIIEMSKSEPSVWRAAANAISILNAANISFFGRDLRRIRIGGNERWGANLNHGLLDGVDLSDADLRYVNFTGAFMSRAKLTGACVDGAIWGELPYYDFFSQLSEQYTAVYVSSPMRWVAIQSIKETFGAIERSEYKICELTRDQLTVKYTIRNKAYHDDWPRGIVAFNNQLELIAINEETQIAIHSLSSGELLYNITPTPQESSYARTSKRYQQKNITYLAFAENNRLLVSLKIKKNFSSSIYIFIFSISHHEFKLILCNKIFCDEASIINMKLGFDETYIFYATIRGHVLENKLEKDEVTDALKINRPATQFLPRANEGSNDRITTSTLDISLGKDNYNDYVAILLAGIINVYYKCKNTAISISSSAQSSNMPSSIINEQKWRRLHTLSTTTLKNNKFANQGCLRFSSCGQYLAAGINTEIFLWNIINAGSPYVRSGHKATITDIDFTDEDKHLITLSDDYNIRMWNFRNKAEFSYRSDLSKQVHSLSISEDGSLMTYIENNNIVIRDINTLDLIAYLKFDDIKMVSSSFIRSSGIKLLLEDSNHRKYIMKNNGLRILKGDINRYYQRKAMSRESEDELIDTSSDDTADSSHDISSDDETMRMHECQIVDKILCALRTLAIKNITYASLESFLSKTHELKSIHVVKETAIVIAVLRRIFRNSVTGYSDVHLLKIDTMNNIITKIELHKDLSKLFSFYYPTLCNQGIYMGVFQRSPSRFHIINIATRKYLQTFHLNDIGASGLPQMAFAINSRFFAATRGHTSGTARTHLHLWDSVKKRSWPMDGYVSYVEQMMWQPISEPQAMPSEYLITTNHMQGIKIWKITFTDKMPLPQLMRTMGGTTGLETSSIQLKRISGLAPEHYRLLHQRSRFTSSGRPSDKPSSEILQARNAQVYIPEGQILYNDSRGNQFRITHQQWIISWVRYRDARDNHTWLIIQGLDEQHYTVIKEAHFYLNTHKPHFFILAGTGFHVIQDKSPVDLEEAYGNDALVSLTWSLSRASVAHWLDMPIVSNKKTYTLEGRIGYNCVSWCKEQISRLELSLEEGDFPTYTSRIVAVPSHYLPARPTEDEPARESSSSVCRLI